MESTAEQSIKDVTNGSISERIMIILSSNA